MTATPVALREEIIQEFNESMASVKNSLRLTQQVMEEKNSVLEQSLNQLSGRISSLESVNANSSTIKKYMEYPTFTLYFMLTTDTLREETYEKETARTLEEIKYVHGFAELDINDTFSTDATLEFTLSPTSFPTPNPRKRTFKDSTGKAELTLVAGFSSSTVKNISGADIPSPTTLNFSIGYLRHITSDIKEL